MRSEQTHRYESLDVWRGIACLAVVAFHANGHVVKQAACLERVDNGTANWADYGILVVMLGWLGVPMFFVISGYCITASAIKRSDTQGAVRGFLRSRFWRIYPPLWFFLIVTIVGVALLPIQWNQAIQPYHATEFETLNHFSGWHWFGMFTLTEQWRPHIIGPERDYLVGTLWTLCYEEQFYIVIAVMMLFGRRWLFPLVAIMTALVYLNLIDHTSLLGPEWGHVTNQYRVWVNGFFFDGLWLAFAAGVGVYYRTHCAQTDGKVGDRCTHVGCVRLHCPNVAQRLEHEGSVVRLSGSSVRVCIAPFLYASLRWLDHASSGCDSARLVWANVL